MKSVFEASSGLEAHMVSNLLQQAGIDTRVDGEYLQGGVGELQARGFVRVLVNDSDYLQAKEVIHSWDENQSTNTLDSSPKRKSSGIGIGLMFGLLIGAGATYLAYNTPVAIDGIDHNDDGKLDEKWVYKDNRISHAEIDRNLDGEIDAIHKYNIRGRIHKTEFDEDFSGSFETHVAYKRGNPALLTADTDQDGVIDYKAFYTDGVPSRTEILDPTSSSPRKVQKYKLNKLVSSKFDSDGDGIYDKQYVYDYYEQIK